MKSNFPDATSKFCGLRLRDGRYVHVALGSLVDAGRAHAAAGCAAGCQVLSRSCSVRLRGAKRACLLACRDASGPTRDIRCTEGCVTAARKQAIECRGQRESCSKRCIGADAEAASGGAASNSSDCAAACSSKLRTCNMRAEDDRRP